FETLREARFRAEMGGDLLTERSHRDAERNARTPAGGALHPRDRTMAACATRGVELPTGNTSPLLDGVFGRRETELTAAFLARRNTVVTRGQCVSIVRIRKGARHRIMSPSSGWVHQSRVARAQVLRPSTRSNRNRPESACP